MDYSLKEKTQGNLVVFSGESDIAEREEMTAVLRTLADALESGDNVGNPLLVLEEQCLRRLQNATLKANSAKP
ncbi:MAG: hypothetical protein GY835_00775 [bacterium]|nr:hypothetical protein [bacterium]